jgi:hypothetical protein
MGCGGFREMRIHDFGLWFRLWIGHRIYRKGDPTYIWSTSIPIEGDFDIFYNGECLGCFYPDGPDLTIARDTRYIIKFRTKFYKFNDTYVPDRLLTLDDFEIVANPDYQELA